MDMSTKKNQTYLIEVQLIWTIKANNDSGNKQSDDSELASKASKAINYDDLSKKNYIGDHNSIAGTSEIMLPHTL